MPRIETWNTSISSILKYCDADGRKFASGGPRWQPCVRWHHDPSSIVFDRLLQYDHPSARGYRHARDKTWSRTPRSEHIFCYLYIDIQSTISLWVRRFHPLFQWKGRRWKAALRLFSTPPVFRQTSTFFAQHAIIVVYD